jgi:hypothetical protein
MKIFKSMQIFEEYEEYMKILEKFTVFFFSHWRIFEEYEYFTRILKFSE